MCLMTQLRELDVRCLAPIFFFVADAQPQFASNQLVAIPREIGRLRALELLCVSRRLASPLPTTDLISQLGDNQITALPREIGQLCSLKHLQLNVNALTSLPSELGALPLQTLSLNRNPLAWLPISLDRLSPKTAIFVCGCPLPADVGTQYHSVRHLLPDVFAATTNLAMILEPAIIILIALQPLFIPALLLVEIVDAAFPNSVALHLKWKLVTAVKHFNERRGIER